MKVLHASPDFKAAYVTLVWVSLAILSNYPGVSAITNLLLVASLVVFVEEFRNIYQEIPVFWIVLFNILVLSFGLVYIAVPVPANAVTETLMVQTSILSCVFGIFFARYLYRPLPRLSLALSGFAVLSLSFGTESIGGRIVGITGNANATAVLLMFIAILLIISCRRSDPRIVTVASFLVSLGFMAYGVVFSGSRKSVLIVAYILLIAAIRWFRKIDIRFRFLAMTLLGMAFVLFVVSGRSLVSLLVGMLESLNTVIDSQAVERLLMVLDGTGEASASARVDMIVEAIRMIGYRPFYGYGNGGFANFNTLHGAFGSYSHNNFAELAVNHGIVGLVVWHVPMFYVLVKVASRPYRFGRLFWAEVLLCGVLLLLEVASVLYTGKTSMVVYGIIVGLYLEEKRSPSVKTGEG